MTLNNIKTLLIRLFGTKITAFIQAIRFVYLIKKSKMNDPEIKFLKHFLSPGTVAIDIGANGADWTYQLYKNVGSKGQIYAFEANPYYALATGLTIKLLNLKNVMLFPVGLSDKDEQVPLRIQDSSGSRYSGRGYVDKSSTINDKGIQIINLRILDSFLKEYPKMFEVALIKCDVEGYEFFVFKGAVEILTKCRPIVILENGNFEKQGYNASTIYKFFKELNYSAFAAIAGELIAKTDDDLNQNETKSVNRILLPNEKVDTYRWLIK